MEKRENETLTVRDIKQILNISINAAYNLIHSKSFPVIRIGGCSRIIYTDACAYETDSL